MKLLTFKQFIAAPVGTIYQRCTPCAVDGFLCMKVAPCGDSDWFQIELTGFDALPLLGSNAIAEAAEVMKSGGSVPWGYGVGRDGMFDYDAMFLVHEREDLLEMAAVLLKAADGAIPDGVASIFAG